MLNLRLRQILLAGAVLFAGLVGAQAAESGGFDLRRFLAPFHSVVLHFPIGFVTMAAILEVWSLSNRSGELRKVILLVLGLGAASAVVAAALGWFRATGGGYDAGALDRHRWFGVGVTVLSVFCFITLLLAHDGKSGRRFLIGVHRLALAGCLAMLMIAGHQGGNLTHGSNYLLEGAPDFIKAMLAEESYGVVEAAPSDKQQQYFVEQVRPIFEAKCYSCHGAEKQRGDYRLDDPKIARKGGESGEVAIKPGDPLGSHLVRLILLPPEDDDVMPPSGKLPLSPEEIGRVIQWIKTGAVFPGESAGTSAAPASEAAPTAP